MTGIAGHTLNTLNWLDTGAVRWAAPEILNAEQDGPDIQYTRASDVFSFGMCLLHVCAALVYGVKLSLTCGYKILSGVKPFSPLAFGMIRHKLLRGEFPDRPSDMHEAMWDIAQSCWQYVPENRPTAATLALHLHLLLD